MDNGLSSYYFLEDGIFVIPIEHLSSDGLSDGFQQLLLEREAFDQGAIDLFNEAYRTYWQRSEDLSGKDGRFWMSPRVQHICVVTRPHYIRPYFQPFNRNSWLMYASDFDPETSNVEFATYQFLHVERMGILQQIVPTLFANLSYFLTLTDEQVDAFCEGCRNATRPDAAGFHALADAMPAVRQLYHQTLHPPTVAIPGARPIPTAGLIVPASTREDLDRLQRSWEASAAEVLTRHRKAHADPAPDRGRRICEWLAETRPRLLVTGEGADILWDHEAPDETDALAKALAEVTEDGEEGILEDLAVVGFHSGRFLDSMRAPDELVDPAPYITEIGLSFIHKERKLVGYSIGPGENENRLWQSSPPYERLMLAARTIHEWGHLAAESGWILIPEARKSEREALAESLDELFQEIHAGASELVRTHTAMEVEQLRTKAGSLGKGLLKGMMVRVEDFQANLLAHRFLRPAEMDTYVRNNVCCHLDEYASGHVWHQLSRLAYEYQYLRLSRIEDPMDWFLKSTWFNEHFIRHGVISEPLFERLIDTIGKIVDCYEIDESKFDFSVLEDS